MKIGVIIPIKKMSNSKQRLSTIIPQHDTKIEKILQEQLKRHGIKFQKHIPIQGQPDIFIEPNAFICTILPWT